MSSVRIYQSRSSLQTARRKRGTSEAGTRSRPAYRKNRTAGSRVLRVLRLHPSIFQTFARALHVASENLLTFSQILGCETIASPCPPGAGGTHY